ncbi:hypothetical protein, partial [Comamonas aquatica]|uniref:hypothetical protein n=1 Tax=Comamonas aquatica TaxID=225991 RepID=UPI0028D3F9E0
SSGIPHRCLAKVGWPAAYAAQALEHAVCVNNVVLHFSFWVYWCEDLNKNCPEKADNNVTGQS